MDALDVHAEHAEAVAAATLTLATAGYPVLAARLRDSWGDYCDPIPADRPDLVDPAPAAVDAAVGAAPRPRPRLWLWSRLWSRLWRRRVLAAGAAVVGAGVLAAAAALGWWVP